MEIISLYKYSEINIVWVQMFSFCLVLDCWLISSRYVYNISSIMIKDIDARIITPTNNGFLLGEALLELLLHDELELVPEFTSFLTSSMETEKEKYRYINLLWVFSNLLWKSIIHYTALKEEKIMKYSRPIASMSVYDSTHFFA